LSKSHGGVMAEAHGSVDFMRMNSAGGRFWMTGDLHVRGT